MKQSFFFVVFFFFISCASENRNNYYHVHSEILTISLAYGKYDNCVYFRGNEMDDMPEDFLFYQDLLWHQISNRDSLSEISQILNKSVQIDKAVVNTYNTDLCMLVHYQDDSVDTLGFELNYSNGFLINDRRYENSELVDYVFSVVSSSVNWGWVLERSKWKGNYKYCSAPFYDTEQPSYNPNYGLYEGTPANDLAKYMAQENMDSISFLIQKDPSLMYCQDPILQRPLIFQCIQFQQDSVLKIFLDNGYDPNYHLKVDESLELFRALPPLMVACENPYFNKCGRLLIEYGADVNEDCSFYGRYTTPLLTSIWHKNYNMIEYLISSGADVNQSQIKNDEELFPLDLTLKMHYYKATLLLLHHGACTNTPFISQKGGILSFFESVDYSKISRRDAQLVKKIINVIKSGKTNNVLKFK